MTLGAWFLQQQAELPTLRYALLIVPFAVLAWRLASLQGPVKRTMVTLCWLLIGALIGFYWAAGYARISLASSLGVAWQGRDVHIEGVVAEMTRPGQRGTRFVFEVERIRTVGAKIPGRISLTWYEKWSGGRAEMPELLAGQRWQLTVRLRPPHGSLNPHGFDIEASMLEREIRATGYVRDGEAAKLLSPMVWRPGYVVERLRERIRRNLETLVGDQPYAGIIIALAVGDQRAISPQQWVVFTQAGVNHLARL